MKAILVLMDSLNRHMMPAYGNDWIIAPNITSFADDCVTFDNHFIGSAPCMPARRDILTSRLNFLERAWGGVEPFDVCFPEVFSEHGIFTHMITDHYHYFEVGGENYHCTFDTWDLHRGQERDPWISKVEPTREQKHLGRWHEQYERNRTEFRQEKDYPSQKTIASAIDWVKKNGQQDNWFMMLEVFDPHEPFECPQEYLDLYQDDYEGPEYIWPMYAPDDGTPEELAHIRKQYAGCLTMLDKWFGKLLGTLKETGVYDDTLIILTTDHGHMLGEHGLMAKNYMHSYNELANIPLFVHQPNSAGAGERRSQLSQNIDMAPTLAEYFGVPWEHPVHGASLMSALQDEQAPTRDYALFGWHGSTVSVTDGKHVYMRAPATAENTPLYQYGCMPGHLNRYWSPERFAEIECGRFLPYTAMPVFRVPEHKPRSEFIKDTLLFDQASDYFQERNLAGTTLEQEYIALLQRAMVESDAPFEQYERLGLQYPAE